MKRKYMLRQGLMILNQLLLIVFLCVMNTIEATIPAENIVHIVLLTFLFWDGYNISGKNVKGNPYRTCTAEANKLAFRQI